MIADGDAEEWGWFYLSTILDDFLRYIIAWKLCTTMKVGDVTETLNLALQASGLDQVHVVHRPRLLSDSGPSYISADLAEWLDKRNMGHVRGAPCHPQTQGKIERWHQTLKNRILLENYYLPGDLEARIDTFVDHYNHRRYHESLDNITPADVYPRPLSPNSAAPVRFQPRPGKRTDIVSTGEATARLMLPCIES